MTLQNILSSFVAALVGFVTAIAIEAAKTLWFERKLRKEEQERQKMQNLLGFYAPQQSESKLPPVARLLISSPFKVVPLKKINLEKSREVVNYKDILIDIEHPSLDDVLQPRQFLFWKLSPKVGAPVLRTHYQPIVDVKTGKKILAKTWETKDDVKWLGRITTIGRREDNDICLQPKEKLISRQHAVIRFENNSYILYNLSITNEICVNGKDMEFCCELKNNDVIEMTPYFIIFEQRTNITAESKK
jgi:hypothetical protein